MLGLYYLILWKGYLEKENTWEPTSTVIHLRKLISTLHKEHPEKSTATSPPLDSTPLMDRALVPKEPKQKRGHPSKGTNKKGKNYSVGLKPLMSRTTPLVDPYLDVIFKPLIQSL